MIIPGITFLQLRKNCQKAATGYPEHRLAVLGDCATQHLATAVKGYAYEAGLKLEVFDADYNQIDAQVMDGQSELYAFEPQTVLLYMCILRSYTRRSVPPLFSSVMALPMEYTIKYAVTGR